MLNSDIIIYTSEDGKTEIKVTVNEETIWRNQYQLEELFNTNRTSIVRHISIIYLFFQYLIYLQNFQTSILFQLNQ